MGDHYAACSLSGNAVLLAAAVPIGILIGLLGVGGIVLVPLLSYLGGCSEHQAVGLSLASFIVLGVMSAIVQLRAGWRPNRRELVLFAAMVPGAIIGALVASYLSDMVLRIVVALAVAATGAWSLVPRASRPEDAGLPNSTRLAAIGAGSGMACAITGAGGPVVVMPLLLVQGVGVREALTLSQVAQFPISLTATVMRSITSGLSLVSASALSVSLVIGLFAGMRMNGIVRAAILQRIVGWSLIGAGVAMFAMIVVPLSR